MRAGRKPVSREELEELEAGSIALMEAEDRLAPFRRDQMKAIPAEEVFGEFETP